MSVSLSKGQRVDLTKGRPSLKNIFVGLGWDINHYDGEADFDLDASAFMTKANSQAADRRLAASERERNARQILEEAKRQRGK